MGLQSIFLLIQTIHFLRCSVCYLCLRETWKTKFVVFAGQSNFDFSLMPIKLDYQWLLGKMPACSSREDAPGLDPKERWIEPIPRGVKTTIPN